MNLDDAPEVYEQGDYGRALNLDIGITEQGEDGSAFNTKGTTDVFNEIGFSLPAGNNTCIGSLSDEQGRRIIWFNHNSNNNHGIYVYNKDALSISTIASGSILKFNTGSRIHSSGVNDNILSFTDNLNPPRSIDIDEAIASYNWSSAVDGYFSDIKRPPLFPPQVTGQNVTGKDDNLNANSYQFIMRYVYKSGEKSVWSTVSKLIAVNYKENEINQLTLDISNPEISGSEWEDVIEFVEIAFRDLYTSPFKFFTRADFSITPSDIIFDDDRGFTELDLTDTDKDYDRVPRLAKTLAIAKNKKFYGNILEGYNQDQVTLGATTRGTTNNIPNSCDIKINQRYFLPDSTYSFGVQFKDAYARRSTVVRNDDYRLITSPIVGTVVSASTLDFTLDFSNPSNHPDWAEVYDIVRSENLEQTTLFKAGLIMCYM